MEKHQLAIKYKRFKQAAEGERQLERSCEQETHVPK